MRIRNAAVAGLFYPDDPAVLQSKVSEFISSASPAAETSWPKAVVAPHAGYRYSGPIAGSAYARIAKGRGTIKRVILIGPAHRVLFRGIALSSADAFATPLGLVNVDKPAAESIAKLSQVVTHDEAHAPEHGLEVHLPFLQETLGSDITFVPLVVGESDSGEAAEVLDQLWGGPETLILISSDLSHFYDYLSAKKIDTHTAESVEALAPKEIQPHQACGHIPLKGLLEVAVRRGLQPKTIDLRNSGDTAGGKDSVVGYGAFTFASSQ